MPVGPEPVSPEPAAVALRRPLLSRAAALPLHAQCREHLVGLIDSGELPPGARLPAERELARAWDVSLAPVRQAILDLVAGGLLTRARGSGTFVRRAHRVEEELTNLSSFTAALAATGLPAEVRVLRQERAPAPPGAAAALGTRARTLLLIERLGLLAGEPVAHLASYLQPDAFPGLERTRLQEGGSLYELLAERHGVRLQRARSTVEVVRCTGTQAAVLDVERGAPALLVEGTTFDERDRPVEFSRVLFRADRFRFTLESRREQDAVVHVIPSPDRSEPLEAQS